MFLKRTKQHVSLFVPENKLTFSNNTLNTLRSRQNGCHFADGSFKCIFLNENVWISLKISLKFVPKVRFNNLPALVKIMAWSRSRLYLSQRWLNYWRIYASLGLNELKASQLSCTTADVHHYDVFDDPGIWLHRSVHIFSLQWRHNGRAGVSNHQLHHCILNRIFGRRSKKTSKAASLAFVRGIHRWPVNSPHKWPVTRKMFPFDDVIM